MKTEKNKIAKHVILKFKILFTGIIFLLAGKSAAQSFFTIDGYVNDMPSIYHIDEIGWLWENQIHNRLNLNLYPFSWLQLSAQGRTRFQQNNFFGKFPGYTSNQGNDPGWVDLTWSIDHAYNGNTGYIFTSGLDRLYAEFTTGDFVLNVGRQRINWSQTFVWNPNDIFNAYSYFDIDYPERPGSDGVRLQYYTGMTSNAELAAKVDSAGKITSALYFRYNALGYDFQLLAGILEEDDLVIGAGWSGNIKSISFRGEASYLKDIKNYSDTTGHLLLSTGLDYTFPNALSLRGELLFSGFASHYSIYSLTNVLTSNMSIKNLGFTKWSLFGSIAYPFTPLINASLAGIYYPEWKGFFLGPSIDFSLGNSLNTALFFQGFSAKLKDMHGHYSRQNTYIGYLRIKWSF